MDYEDLENTVEDHEDRLGAIEDLDLPDYTDTNDENIADLQQNEGQLTFPLSQDTIDLLNENSTDFLQLPDTITLLNSLLSIVSINGRSHGTATTTVSNSADTKMTLTNDFANGITWDDTNKRFVILTAGQYQINTQISWNNTSSASYLYTKIFKNGSIYSYGFMGGIKSFGFSDILDLAVNDYIELYAYQNTGSSQTVNNDQSTLLSIAKI